jgi:hypothetical protein
MVYCTKAIMLTSNSTAMGSKLYKNVKNEIKENSNVEVQLPSLPSPSQPPKKLKISIKITPRNYLITPNDL